MFLARTTESSFSRTNKSGETAVGREKSKLVLFERSDLFMLVRFNCGLQ